MTNRKSPKGMATASRGPISREKKRPNSKGALSKGAISKDSPLKTPFPKNPAKKTRSREAVLRQHLDERIRALYHRALVLERELIQLDKQRKFYRTCIFGSARLKPNMPAYGDVFSLARFLAWRGIDILTGGGPGLMEAANKGAKLGQREKSTRSLSFGLPITLPWEPLPNKHLDVKRHHEKFSSRLDDFMRLSHSIIVTPGGIGTLLELFFAWQLVQVKHISPRPIVLLNKSFWVGIMDWIRTQPLAQGLMSAPDLDYISIVDTPEEVLQIISAHHQQFIAAMKVVPVA